jgi:hypothetical protein
VCVIFIFTITKKKYSIYYTVFITSSTNLLLTSGTRARVGFVHSVGQSITKVVGSLHITSNYTILYSTDRLID